MTRREPSQELLLNYLYGLLAPEQQHEVEELLRTAPEWQAACTQVRQQLELLAEAARSSFAEVRFEPPSTSKERLLPRRQEERDIRRPSFRRWLLAAAVLLAVVGLGVGGWSWLDRYGDLLAARQKYHSLLEEQSRRQKEREAEQQKLQDEMRAIQEQIKLIETNWKQSRANTIKEINDKQLHVVVTGPRTLQAGARNEYQIQTRRGGLPVPGQVLPASSVPAKVTARVVEAPSKKVVFERSLPTKNGLVKLELPQDLPVKPNTQFNLEVQAEDEHGNKAQVSEALPLIGTLFVTHLTTDRPMYRPGETVRFRSLTLERFSLKPPQEVFDLTYTITNPQGATIFTLTGTTQLTSDPQRKSILLKGSDGQPLQGLGAGEFTIPADVQGGVYTLSVKENSGRFPEEKRKFLVNQYQAPRLNKEVEFTRKSYGPGDVVEALCKVARVEGGKPMVNTPILARVNVDGQAIPVETPELRTNELGQALVRFTLPQRIERGAASLSVEFRDGQEKNGQFEVSVTETTVRPIPIVLKKMFLEFYPEGGDLVAGVPNRVYFQARTPLGKPAEILGRLIDETGKEVRVVDHSGKEGTVIQTLSDDIELGANQGLGWFSFTPQAGKKYQLKIEVPIGIESQHFLPASRTDGVVLNVPEGVVSDKINVVLHGTSRERKLLVGAYCRGRLLDHTTVTVKPGEPAKVTLRPMEGVSGVYRVTAFEEQTAANGVQLRPVAERLIFRRPVERLDFSITPSKSSYSPGERVEVKLQAKTEKKAPAPAVLLVSVVDRSIIKLADEKTARSMPTHFFLTTEVRKAEDLEHADFLVSEHPKAELALDMLLGTQGWRRFAEQDPQVFRKMQQQKEPAEAERLLLVNGLAQPEQNDLAQIKLAKIDNQFLPQWQQKQSDLAQVEKTEEEKRAAAAEEAQVLLGRIQMAAANRSNADDNLRRHTWFLAQILLAILGTGLLIAGVVGVVMGMLRMSQGQRGHLAYLAGGLCCLMILFIGGAATVVLFLANLRDDGAFPFAQRKVAAVHPLAAEKGGEAFDRPQDREDPKVDQPKLGQNAVDHMAQAMQPPPRPAAPVRVPLPEAPVEPGGKPPVVPPVPVAGVEPQIGPGHKGDRAEIVAQVQPQPAAPFPGAAKQWRAADLRAPDGRGGGMPAPLGEPMPFGRPAPPGFFPGAPVPEVGLVLPVEQERELRRQMELAQLARFRLGLNIQVPQRQPLYVREYAHEHIESKDGVRRDFTETLYWHPAVVLTDGEGKISFDLSDAVTTFDVVVWGHGLDGRLGAATQGVVAKLPFSVEPTVPIEITSNDKVTIPVSVVNRTSAKRSVEIDAAGVNLNVIGAAKKTLLLDPESRLRSLFTFQPAVNAGAAKLRVTGRSAPFGSDAVERTFQIVPEGFPIVVAKSDMLEGDARHTVELPESWVKGSLQLRVQVFPSTLAELQKGLEGLLREPCGCFEQASTSNYPNVLILNYLKESDQSRPEIESRARRLLDDGYARLVGYECFVQGEQGKKRGYEWFGGTAPPHEALTAYGLLQFKDMAKVYKVDPEMLERTLRYLLDQRDGKGGFKRNPQALDTFGQAPEHITNAYIVWALTEAGVQEKLDKEFDALLAKAKTTKDPYFLSLVANALLNVGRSKEAVALLKEVAGKQKDDGHVPGAQTSITSSGGRDLEIETTALALLGWLKANQPAEFNTPVQKASTWIGKQRGGYGGFGSTQSTILALKALIAYTSANRKTSEAGELKLYVNNSKQPVAVKSFPAGSLEELIVSVPREDMLVPGKNDIRVEMTGKNAFPYTLTLTYNTLKPASAEKAPVRLSTQLDRDTAREGETVRLTATVENRSGKGQGMTLAILGLPAGLEVPPDHKQLKEMMRLRDNDTKPGEISFYEIRGRELVLYWRDLGPTQKIEVSLDLVCRLPGEYRGPASRAYLYYHADHKYWTEPLSISIAPQ